MRLGPIDQVLMLCPELNHAADSYCVALGQVVVARSHLASAVALELGAANLAGRECVALASALGQRPWLLLIENREALPAPESRSGWLGLALALDLAALQIGPASGFTELTRASRISETLGETLQLRGPANELLCLYQRETALQVQPALTGAVLACPQPALTRAFYQGLGALDAAAAGNALALRGAHQLSFVTSDASPAIELAAATACGIGAVAFARSNVASERLDERYQSAVPQHLRGQAGELIILL